jgi:hypothetical protein
MRTLQGFALLVAGACFAVAGSVCPGATTGTNFTHPPDPTGTGCNVVITIAANGSISTVITDASPYEGSEDALVGIVNNSGTPLSSINLTGTASPGIFQFEGDGVCTFTFAGSGYCATGHSTDPQDYAGPTSSFPGWSSASNNSGTVAFSPAVAANGGSTYFSLEGIPTANIAGGGINATPAPGTLVLFGIGLTLLTGWSFRSQIRAYLFSR